MSEFGFILCLVAYLAIGLGVTAAFSIRYERNAKETLQVGWAMMVWLTWPIFLIAVLVMEILE